MTCEYCDGVMTRFVDSDDPFDDYRKGIELFVEIGKDYRCKVHPELVAEVSGTVLGCAVEQEVRVDINFCPMCGRDLREVDE